MKTGTNAVRRAMSALFSIGAIVTGFLPFPSRGVEYRSEIGVDWLSFHYSEDLSTINMSEDGEMFGVFAAVTCDFPDWMLRVDGSYDYGTLTYQGWLVDSLTGDPIRPVELDTPNTIVNLKIAGGRKYRLGGGDTVVTPTVGLGYRYLLNDLPGIGGYTREQSYLYLPVGAGLTAAIDDAWSWSFQAEFDGLARGWNESGGDSFTQDSGYGFRISAGLNRAVPGEGSTRVSIEPYYQYWNVGESSVSSGGYVEPDNSTREYGIRASVLF